MSTNLPVIPDDAPAALVEARDAHVTAKINLDEFDEQHRDLLADDYRVRAEKRDVQAAKDAALQGKDVSKLKSHAQQAELDRPRVLGQQAALKQRVGETRKALTDACFESVNTRGMRRKIAGELTTARDEMLAAYDKYQKAQNAWGAALTERKNWEAMESQDPDISPGQSGVPTSLYRGEHVPPPKQLVAAATASFKRQGIGDPHEFSDEPTGMEPLFVTVRDRNGGTSRRSLDQAIGSVAKGAEFANPVVAERYAAAVERYRQRFGYDSNGNEVQRVMPRVRRNSAAF